MIWDEVAYQKKVILRRYHPKCRNCDEDMPLLLRGNKHYGVRFCSEKCRATKRKEDRRKYSTKYNKELKVRVFDKLGGAKCVYCGCDDIKVLEVNHINGGGVKELHSTPNFKLDIVSGRRKIDDLEVTCRVCNAWHYIKEKVSGEWKIKWSP